MKCATHFIWKHEKLSPSSSGKRRKHRFHGQSFHSAFILFAYYNRINQKENKKQALTHDHSFCLIWWRAAQKHLEKNAVIWGDTCRPYKVLFILAPVTKRKTTFPPGRVWVLKCSLMDGFIHQARSVHSSTAELPWGTVSDSDHSASLWNHINI